MKRLLLLFLAALPFVALALAWLALSDRPQIAPAAALTPEQIRRAEALAKAQDPRRSPDGSMHTLTLASEDLELAANHLLAPHNGAAKLVLQPGVLTFWASAAVPDNPFGRYVNVEGALRQTSRLPQFDELRIGRIPVPAVVADWMLARALAQLPAVDEGQPAADLVQRVQIDSNRVRVVYQWRKDLLERARAAALPPIDVPRLRAYQVRLTEIAVKPAPGSHLPLRSLLAELFATAAERSQNGDAEAENRALLLALVFYVNGRGLEALAPQAREWPRPQARKVLLGGRHDLARHFTVSAALAALAGTPLADALGLQKEVEDARAGSGFSFADLAADRAGTVLGAHAVRSREDARALQRRFASGVEESDFMPAFADLPEGMDEQTFKRQFGGVGGPEYLRMQAEIDRRVGALAAYRMRARP